MQVEEMTKKLVEAKYTEVKKTAVKEVTKMYTTAVYTVLRDKHGFGKKRLKRMGDDLENVFLSIAEGYVTLDDLIEVLYEETGVRI